MIYETDTGVGYFEDEQGRVVDRVRVAPGEHEAGAPRETFVEVSSVGDLPGIDDHYRPDPPSSNRTTVAELETRIADLEARLGGQ